MADVILGMYENVVFVDFTPREHRAAIAAFQHTHSATCCKTCGCMYNAKNCPVINGNIEQWATHIEPKCW